MNGRKQADSDKAERKISLKDGWSNVDAANDPARFVSLMDQVRGRKDNPAQYATVRELLDVRPGHCVLDVGCGTGAAVRIFSKVAGRTGKVIGVDNSETMIKEAKKRSNFKDLSIEFRVGDAHHLPFPDNYFDRVLALRVFEILENPLQALKEILRVTKPGGRIYLNGPDVDGWTFDVADRDVTRCLLHYICDYEVNGWIGLQLPRLCAEIGAISVEAFPHTEFSSDFELISNLYLKDLVNSAQLANVIAQETADAWLKGVQLRCEAGAYAHSQRLFRVVATKR